jgi:hypothetical protein
MSMSELDDGQFCWRDTYFVWFASAKRPTAAEIKQVLSGLPEHYLVGEPTQDEAGRFESIAVQSPGDHAALEISCLAGDDLREQAQALAEELKFGGDADARRLTKLAMCDARFDVMQFEQIEGPDAELDAADEAFDPSTLLIVMNALTKLVDGIGVDPQSGLML